MRGVETVLGLVLWVFEVVALPAQPESSSLVVVHLQSVRLYLPVDWIRSLRCCRLLLAVVEQHRASDCWVLGLWL